MIIRTILIGYFVCSITYATESNITNVLKLNRKVRQVSGCELPAHPRNGQWSLLGGGTKFPGDTVSDNSILEFKCDTYYQLTKSKHVICSRGWNPQEMPECEALCTPRFSTSTTFLQCFNKVGAGIDCKEATHGSYMKYTCGPFYEPTPGHRKIIYCVDGLWSTETPQCRPTCGVKNDAMPLVFGGTALDKLEYPWIVAIYKKEKGQYLNICGGTIIHRKAVLTAAHCVADELGVGLPVETFEVAAAKLHNNYGDPNDKEAQYRKIFQFIVHPQYKDNSRRFLGDIAVVVTELPFQLNSFVKPVCINDLNTIYLQPGATGEIAGWGVTETGKPADELRFLEIPHKYNEDCIKELPIDWAEKYNLIDKMCAGSPQKKISVCKGDSGAGLVFKNIEDSRYYVHGIVSLAPSTTTGDLCNVYSSALYTKVSFYYEFVDLTLTRLNWCRLPNYPKNGKWKVQRHPNKVPGDIVSPHDIIEVSCNEGYALTTMNSAVGCETLVLNPASCKATGNVDKKKQEPPVQQKPTAPTPPINIGTGQCGIKVDGSKGGSSNIDEERSSHIDYPWVVLLYKNRKYLGHGNILTRKLIITGARDLTVWNEWTLLNAAEIAVGTGKYYKYYGDPREPDAKYYKAEKIYHFEEFKGTSQGLYGDIGFVVLKERIQYNTWAQPICLQGVNNITIKAGDILEIVGWVDTNNTVTVTPRADKAIIKKLSQCLKESSDLDSYLSQDAICAGPLDNVTCIRHSGSGLVYENPVDSRYYLAALFGFGVIGCGGRNNFYISMKYHYDYIIEQMGKYN